MDVCPQMKWHHRNNHEAQFVSLSFSISLRPSSVDIIHCLENFLSIRTSLKPEIQSQKYALDTTDGIKDHGVVDFFHYVLTLTLNPASTSED